MLIYLRGHEGRGIGIGEKIRAYALQEDGADTVDANVLLGHLPDARDYTDAATILIDLGITSARVLTNNPAKTAALQAGGIEVIDRVAMVAPATAESARYLATKRDRMGHVFD